MTTDYNGKVVEETDDYYVVLEQLPNMRAFRRVQYYKNNNNTASKTTKTLKKFMHKKVAYYTDGGECVDLGSEGDFGHFAALNFELFYDKAGTKPVPSEEWPDEAGFYEKACDTSEALLMSCGRWGFDQHGW